VHGASTTRKLHRFELLPPQVAPTLHAWVQGTVATAQWKAGAAALDKAAPAAGAAATVGSKRPRDAPTTAAPAPAAGGAGAAAGGAGGSGLVIAATAKKGKKAAADSLSPEEIIAAVSGAAVVPSDDALMRAPLIDLVKAYMTAVVYDVMPAAREVAFDVAVETNARPGHQYHYYCPAPVHIAGKLKGKPGIPTTAVEVAELILAGVAKVAPSPAVGRVVQLGSGNLAIYAAVDFLAHRVARVLAKGVEAPVVAKPQRVLVDYSSPNIAKEMHIGHLRSTIIGDAIARILEFCGHELVRVNHVGDWGTQFGMLISQLKDAEAAGEDISTFDIARLTTYYKAAKVRFDADPAFKERAHREVVALQAGDARNRALWQQMIAVSQATYDQGQCTDACTE